MESGGKELPTEKSHRKAPTNVIDLVAVLQKSLQETGRAGGKPPGHAKPKATPKRKSHKTHKKAA
jgi:non-homologous end joining protein Ku